jgi:hypothetical protein
MKKGTIKIFAALELYKKKVLFLFYGQVICIDSYCFLEATSLRTPSECSAWNMGKLFEMQTCQFQKIPSAAAHKNSHIPISQLTSNLHQTVAKCTNPHNEYVSNRLKLAYM